MGDVVQFKPADDGRWLTGPCKCFKCKHEWNGAMPVGNTVLECPNCGADGVPLGIVNPLDNTGFVCKCGCDLYRIDKEGPFCINCGIHATGWF